MLGSRRPLKITCQRQVFQIYPPRNQVTLRDVDDLLTATTKLEVDDKKSTFYAHGADYDRVMKYHMQVKYLNTIYYKKTTLEVLDSLYYPLWCFWRLVKVFLSMLFGLL